MDTGKTKSNQGWTPLHLASYFGHRDVAEVLLQNGASLDELNDAGDTPLHKAALTNREVREKMIIICKKDCDFPNITCFHKASNTFPLHIKGRNVCMYIYI